MNNGLGWAATVAIIKVQPHKKYTSIVLRGPRVDWDHQKPRTGKLICVLNIFFFLPFFFCAIWLVNLSYLQVIVVLFFVVSNYKHHIYIISVEIGFARVQLIESISAVSINASMFARID